MKNWTTLGIIFGAAIGLLSGWLVGSPMKAVQWMGDLFLNALKFIVIPLIFSAMIVGISGLGDVRKLGRFGGLTIGYFVITTFISVAVGLVLVLIIQPGSGYDVANSSVPSRLLSKSEFGFRELILKFVGGERSPGNFSSNFFYSLANMEMLPIVTFSLILGAVLTTLGETGKPVIAFFKGFYEAIMKIVHGIIWFAPLGVFGLVASKIGGLGGGPAVAAELAKLAMYTGTVVLGLFIHGFVILPAILFFVAKRSPLQYAKGMSEALLTALSTASSAATLPLTTKCVIKNNDVSERSATFVLPVGATVNMDGTALYEGVAVLFIAQALGVDLGLTQVLLVFILSTMAAMAAAAIPEAGLVTMVVILKALDLPVEAIGLLLTVDWFLDRCRTTINVWGDSVGTAVIDRLQKSSSAVRLEAL